MFQTTQLHVHTLIRTYVHRSGTPSPRICSHLQQVRMYVRTYIVVAMDNEFPVFVTLLVMIHTYAHTYAHTYVRTYISTSLLSLMVQVPDGAGLPSVHERIDSYCKEVKSRGGTPPTLTAGSRLRYRRFTAPQLDFPNSFLAQSGRDRSSSSTDISLMSPLQGHTLMKAAKEGNVKGIVNGASGGMRKPSVLSVREIQVDFGNGGESDSNNGGDDDAANDLMVPVTLTGQMELQRLREENRLLHKQLKAVQSGGALLPCLSEDDPRVSGTCIMHVYCTVPTAMDCVFN